MSFEHDFEIKKYFPGGVNTGKLDKEIRNNNNLKNILEGIITSNEILTIIFEKILNNQEKDELLTIFKDHKPEIINATKVFEVVHMVDSFQSELIFTMIVPIIYPKILSYEKIVG